MYIYIYIYICNIYLIKKTMCPPGYHHNGFVATAHHVPDVPKIRTEGRTSQFWSKPFSLLVQTYPLNRAFADSCIKHFFSKFCFKMCHPNFFSLRLSFKGKSKRFPLYQGRIIREGILVTHEILVCYTLWYIVSIFINIFIETCKSR